MSVDGLRVGRNVDSRSDRRDLTVANYYCAVFNVSAGNRHDRRCE